MPDSLQVIRDIVSRHIERHVELLPGDLSESVVIHARAMQSKSDVHYVESILADRSNRKYVVGEWADKEHAAPTEDEFRQIVTRVGAEYLRFENVDLDMCCSVKAGEFIAGPGFLSRLIVELRKKGNAPSIEYHKVEW